jgi:uracil-DNA glycosylase family 4
MQGEATTQLRAWVEYFRDLGVYDFYRRGEFEPVVDLEAVDLEAEAQPRILTKVNAVEAPVERSVRAPVHESHVPALPAEPSLPSRTTSIPLAPTLKLVSFNDLAPLPAAPVPAADRAAALRAIQEEIGDCTRCPLAYAGRRKIVFGDGSPTARLMFVGEGPGADEDAQGMPFVGKAGQLLNNMITAMGLARSEVYIANIVKCRPPSNRVPESVEANTCSQFLLRQIDVVQPEVIVALGATAAMYLLGVKQPLSSLRGQWHTCRGAKLAVTYHPAFLLRDPRQKAEAWKDLQMVMGELGLKPPQKKA